MTSTTSSTPPNVWTVQSTDADVVTINGAGQDIVDIDWGDSSWFTITHLANGSVEFTDVHATGHSVIVTGVAEVVFGRTVYDVATGTFGTSPATPASVLAIAPPTTTQTKTGSVYTFTVTRTGNTDAAATVNWTVSGSGSNPAPASIFSGGVLPSGVLSFVAGQTSLTFTVSADSLPAGQPNENFTVTLADPSSTVPTSIGTADATGTIPSGPKTWDVAQSDSAVTTITGSGEDIVNIEWGDASWFKVTQGANGALDFTDIHATGHEVIVSGVADVIIGGAEYDVATGSWGAVSSGSSSSSSGSGQTTTPPPANGSAPSTPPQTVNGVTTWTVNSNDAATVSITGTGKDIVDLTWGDASWYIVTKESDGSVEFLENHATGHEIFVSNVADVVVGGSEYDIAQGAWVSASTSTSSGSSGTSGNSGTTTSGQSSSTPPDTTPSLPSTPPDIAGDGVATWTVEATDAPVVSITGTGEDIVDITWGQLSWFTVTTESDGSVEFMDNHGTGHEVIVDDVATVIVDNEKYDVKTGTWSPIVTTPPVTAIPTPSVPQASGAGQVVGLTLQNSGTTAIDARYITFGEQFSEGQVPAGGNLVVIINGQTYAVQMEVKTTYADGSVQSAVLTMQQPALAAGQSLNAVLALGTANTASAVDLGTLTDGKFKFTVGMTLHNADGSTTALSYDAAALLQAALKAGTVTYLQKGPEATEVTFNVAVQSSMFLTFDITLYADGSTHTNVEFNNDIAMGATGGTMTYDVAISQNGTTVLQQNNVTQYQYQTWHEDVWSNGTPQVNVVRDVAALEAAGLIQNYDPTVGVSSATLGAELNQLGGSTYGILGSGSITQYMPETGLRADIGPMSEWEVVAFLTQNAQAQAYAQDQADATGSIPWHLIDPTTGDVIDVTNYPDLWDDYRAGPQYGGIPLTQPVSDSTGWSIDFSHAPDADYLQYLETGSSYYLDQLNAEAAAIPLHYPPGDRDEAQGVFATIEQVRGTAWDLRTLVEAAVANPDGSADKAYFTQLVNNNLNALLSFTQTAQEGQLTGWFPGANGASGSVAPWQQAFLATSLAFAAENGFSVATQLVSWETNFLAGEYLNGANGFSPWEAADYELTMSNSSGQLYQTWSGVLQASQPTGYTNPNYGSWPTTDYVAINRAALADDITVTQSTEAIQAFGWLSANTGGINFQTYFENDPTYDIAPRLSDGNLLTLNNIFIYDDANTVTITAPGGNADQLVFEQGTGNVTLQGGNGINILFGGAGPTTINGGNAADYLYAGTGAATIYGGAGNNFMQSGSPTAYTAGATTFVLKPGDSATDTISGFRTGTDHLQIAGDAPGSSALSRLISGATNGSSGAVLHLSSAHDVTLLGISTSQLSQSMFS